MCPYCGEEIAARAVQCAKCGMVLDDAAGGEAIEAPPEPAAAPAKKKQVVVCPSCGEPNPAKNHRCAACGRPIRELVTKEHRDAERRFRLYIRAGVAGAVVLVLVVVLVGTLMSSSAPKNIEWSKIPFADVDRLFGTSSKLSSEKRQELWNRGYAGKWVRWEGKVAEVESAGVFGSGALLVRQHDGKGRPDVRVRLARAELAKPGVAEGAAVSYAGRLRAWGELVELSDGLVYGAKK